MAVSFKSSSSGSSGKSRAPKTNVFSGAAMKPMSGSWKKKVLTSLAGLLGVLSFVIGYGYFQLTAKLPKSAFHGRINIAAQEAAEKYQIFQEALRQKQKGFAPFSELQLNAYLKENVMPKEGALPLKSTTTGFSQITPVALKNISLKLEPPTLLEWKAHVEVKWLGTTHDLFLRRQMELIASMDSVDWREKRMMAGNVQIPEAYRSYFTPVWDEIMEPFTDELKEIVTAPFVRIIYNKELKENEIQLFTVSKRDGFGKSSQDKEE